MLVPDYQAFFVAPLFVEAAADAVSAEFLHDGVAGIFGNLLAGIADVAEGGAGFDRFIPAIMEAWVTSIRRWAIGETLPTVNIRLESPWKPSF